MTKRSQLLPQRGGPDGALSDRSRPTAATHSKAPGRQRRRVKSVHACNAVRHGLTAETVIAALEDQEDYQAFEAAVIADYDFETAVERELVLRLASVLWRLRRATGIETALFELVSGGPHKSERRRVSQTLANQVERNRPLLRAVPEVDVVDASELTAQSSKKEITGGFLRLINLPTFALDRLSRYEHTLWRQARQLVFTLESSLADDGHGRAAQ